MKTLRRPLVDVLSTGPCRLFFQDRHRLWEITDIIHRLSWY